MRIAVQDRFGGPDVIHIVTRDRPLPGPGEVLVRVHAASVNAGECKVRAGRAPELGSPPLTLGSDLSGTVEALGPGVDDFAPGDEVYGAHFIGTYADFVVIPASSLAGKPRNVDHVHAAALPVAALTAWTATTLAQTAPGQRILVHAAAGGVGHLAVQMAGQRGAEVFATARSKKHDFLAGLGVHRAVDYTTHDFTAEIHDMDTVIDLVGGEYGPRSLRSLRPGGLLLTAAMDTGVTQATVEESGRQLGRIGVRPSGVNLRRITRMVEDGTLRVHVQETFPLDELPAAHALSESQGVTGKLVITLT